MKPTKLFAYLSLVLAYASAALAADPIPFANYARFIPTGPTTLNALFEVGPFVDQLAGFAPEGGPLPGWDANVEATIVAAGDPPSIDEATLIATLPLFDTLTVTARDAEGNEVGRYSTLATGAQKLDLSAANAIVDNVAGTIQLQFGGSLLNEPPAFPNTLVEAAGIYASAVQIADDGFAHAGGTLTLPLDDDPNTALQENILSAYAAGQIIGVDVVAVYGGTYVPEPSSTLLLMLGVALLPRMVRRSSRSNAS